MQISYLKISSKTLFLYSAIVLRGQIICYVHMANLTYHLLSLEITLYLSLFHAGMLRITCHGTYALIQLPTSQLDRSKDEFADVIRWSLTFNDGIQILWPTISCICIGIHRWRHRL